MSTSTVIRRSRRRGAVAGAYVAPRWLPDAHSQTIWPALYAPRPRLAYRRVRWQSPDGDFIDLDWLPAPPGSDAQQESRRPLLALFHGLEGCSRSHYAVWLMAAAAARGWRGVVLHFRGCSGEPNLLPRAYHSGDSEEVDWLLRRLRREHAADAPLVAAGVSLGGNALLKWAGERDDAHRVIDSVAAISAPHDLHAGAVSLSRGFNRVYTWNFLKTLKRKSLRMLERHPGLFDAQRLRDARDFFEFDEVVTAPLHGFRSALDYWQRSSCGPYLASIRVPTLVLNAQNDPFLPAAALVPAERVARAVRIDYPLTGGHVGFVDDPFPGRMEWLAERVLGHLAG